MGLFTVRPAWDDTPAAVRYAVESLLGSAILAARDVHGGMSPGPAAVARLADGRSAFVKALTPSPSQDLYRAEARALGLLPSGTPAPALLGTVEIDGWFALVTEAIDGDVAGPPWTDAAARAVERACARTAASEAPACVRRVRDVLPDLDGWANLATGPELDTWERSRATRLAGAVAGWRDWTSGTALLHHDVRCDNAIIGADGEATLVDWAFCAAGAPWLDRAMLAADVAASDHVDGPEHATELAAAMLAGLPAYASRFVIGLAGMWRFNSTLPAHPGLSTHRAWQRERAMALRPLVDSIAV